MNDFERSIRFCCFLIPIIVSFKSFVYVSSKSNINILPMNTSDGINNKYEKESLGGFANKKSLLKGGFFIKSLYPSLPRKERGRDLNLSV